MPVCVYIYMQTTTNLLLGLFHVLLDLKAPCLFDTKASVNFVLQRRSFAPGAGFTAELLKRYVVAEATWAPWAGSAGRISSHTCL